MILIRLFFEFCKVGLFSVGGGLATIPFLADLGERTGWFTSGQLADMIAISESTPGPMGVNMATYVGFSSAGVAGGVVATLGLVFPSIVVILIISGFLQKFRHSKAVDGVFYGLRAASVALITAAMLQVARIALMFHTVELPDGGTVTQTFYWPAILLAAVIFVLIRFTPLKKLHPICFIALAAVVGVIFRL
ncbi:MAG: chromate transporter [Oscillospiraceae bacterium]|nr:chromate transporter [Oscillospiraceae bacterium]